jgi:hypothetical protein
MRTGASAKATECDSAGGRKMTVAGRQSKVFWPTVSL